MDDEIVIPIPTPAPAAPSTGEVLAAAESMVQQAQQIAHMPDAESDRIHELIAICSEVRDDVRTIRVQLEMLQSGIDSVRASQIVAEVIAEEEPAIVEVPEVPAPATVVEVNAPSGDAVVEKETVVDDNPPIPQKRGNEKPARRWL